MCVMSRSLAATSCSIGVKRKKLSRLTSVISTSSRRGAALQMQRRVDAAEPAAEHQNPCSVTSDLGRLDVGWAARFGLRPTTWRL